MLIQNISFFSYQTTVIHESFVAELAGHDQVWMKVSTMFQNLQGRSVYGRVADRANNFVLWRWFWERPGCLDVFAELSVVTVPFRTVETAQAA